MATAKSVPKCNDASKVSPNVFWEIENNFSKIIKWPVEEIGKNSVKPCTAPAKTARKKFILKVLLVDYNSGTNVCPVKNYPRFFGLHVDTTMAHRMTKIIVPICTVYPVALIVIHGVRNIG